jgi:O-antigen ligase
MMGLALVLSGWTNSSWETIWTRRAAATVTVLALPAIYFTYFRTTWGIALLLLFLWMRQRGMTAVALGLVVSAVCVAVLAGQLPRLEHSSIVQTRLLSGENVSTRLATNEKAIEIFKERPFTGIGWNNFSSDQRVIEVNGVENVDTPHNTYLGVLAELGLVGITLFGLAAAAALAGLVRLRRAASSLPADAKWIPSGFLWVPILFLVFSLDFQILTLPYPTVLFFGCGGIAAALASRQTTQ